MIEAKDGIPADQLAKLQDRAGVCWGLKPGNSGLTPDRESFTVNSADGGELRNPADPEGWRISGGVTDHRAAAEHTLENREEERHVLNRLDLLEERERTVITLRFGLDGERPHTLNEIGLRLGITREWVRKIEQKAVRKLDPKYANILTVQSNRRPHAGPA